MFPPRADCCVCVRLCASERKREREKESVLAKGVVIGKKNSISLSYIHSHTNAHTHGVVIVKGVVSRYVLAGG